MLRHMYIKLSPSLLERSSDQDESKHPEFWTNEYAIVELQGSLVANDTEEASLDSMHLGSFTIKANGDPVLTVGNLQLDGRVVALPKPLAIMQRVEGEASRAEHEGHQYHIVGIVRSKYLFKHRPKPVANVASS